MLKLTKKRVGALSWIIENLDKEWSIYELEKGAHALDYSATHTFVGELKNAGFIVRTNGKYRLSNATNAIQYLSLFQPFRARQSEGFYAAGDMKAKMSLIEGSGLPHAFTLFSAGELLFPYVKTEDVHAYVRKADFELWRDYLVGKRVRRATAREANLTLMPVEEEYYFTGKEIRNHRIAPMGIVLADLISYGGLGEEQAEMIKKEWLRGRANV